MDLAEAQNMVIHLQTYPWAQNPHIMEVPEMQFRRDIKVALDVTHYDETIVLHNWQEFRAFQYVADETWREGPQP